jgi:hypothetical protein
MDSSTGLHMKRNSSFANLSEKRESGLKAKKNQKIVD